MEDAVAARRHHLSAVFGRLQSDHRTACPWPPISRQILAPYSHTAKDKECLQRAMFFESNRSSRDGMIAVGTVVMNRLRSGKHGNTICQVVGESGQFAPGVMTRPMNSKAMPDVEEAAEAVLKGERKAKLKNSMFFHTAGLRFPYKNMHYTMVAGGNAFYEKRGRNWKPLPDEPTTMVAQATPRGSSRRTGDAHGFRGASHQGRIRQGSAHQGNLCDGGRIATGKGYFREGNAGEGDLCGDAGAGPGPFRRHRRCATGHVIFGGAGRADDGV